MKMKARKEWELTLILDEDEALWLRDLVQNYLGEGEEGIEEHKMRKKFWDALNGGFGFHRLPDEEMDMNLRKAIQDEVSYNKM